MSIIKNEIPILEYDLDSKEILRPDLNMENVCLPEKCVYAFLGGTIDSFAEKHGAVCVNALHTITKNYPIYEVMYRGQRITLCQAPLGASAAVQNLDSLIACGVKKIVCAGSCGALQDYPENLFLIPVHALRDEGTSYHYLPPSRFVHVSDRVSKAIEKIITAHEFSFTEVMTWSTDGFFRETREKVLYRKKEGCSAVEMECSALAACAQMRGAEWGELLYAGDTLANVNQYDERGSGDGSREIALQLCMEAVKLL